MKGDYHRYYAEIAPEAGQRQAALDAYDKATEVANTSLAPTHPIRLGLAINFSVFYYEIMREHERGLELARQAYDEAVAEIETLDDESNRESNLFSISCATTSILGTLSDRLTERCGALPAMVFGGSTHFWFKTSCVFGCHCTEQ
ncbi:putative 14 3 3 protein [Trypanosoma vivax]|nr:putative 14 3 3 protein [Trypanosoma vivax]